MSNARIVIPLPDYERVFRVIYSVINEDANMPHSCIFFALVGAAILENKYEIEAMPIAGAAAYVVHGPSGGVSTFGRIDGENFVSGDDAFHCWVQARGIVVDFMAPLFGESLKSFGHDVPVPSRMFQKPLREMSSSVRDLRGEGAFYLKPDAALTAKVFQAFSDDLMSTDLANICLSWYRKPPKSLPTNMGMRDNSGRHYLLSPKGPSISGVW